MEKRTKSDFKESLRGEGAGEVGGGGGGEGEGAELEREGERRRRRRRGRRRNGKGRREAADDEKGSAVSLEIGHFNGRLIGKFTLSQTLPLSLSPLQ